MTRPIETPTTARRIVDLLVANGVERVFMVPGESFLAVIDALADAPIETVVTRHESGAAFMADATGRLTGRPGIAMVTRAPGATNAFAGLHVAEHDGTPMILFVGGVDRGFRHRGAFQEMDYRAVFGTVAKWVVELDDPARTDEIVSRAFSVATAGRPGPVVVVLPEDVLGLPASAGEIRPAPIVDTHPGSAQMWELQKRLWAAERPIAILGGSRWSETAVRRFARFAEKFDLPVACSFRRQMLFDHADPHYVGDVGLGLDPALAARIRASDLVLLIGGRFAEVPSQGYELVDLPFPSQALVHVHPSAEELGRVFRPDLAVHATPAAFAAAAEALEPPPAGVAWAAWREAARADRLAWSGRLPVVPGAVKMGEVIAGLAARLSDDAILTNGAGNYATWIHRFWSFRKWGTQVAPTSGSMGYGLPAAIAAKLLHPERPVVAFAGDGCFQMTGPELATAVQYGVGIVVLVVDNGSFGTIRMHQERNFPGRVHATGLVNPDFAALARAHGALGLTVERAEEIGPALDAALAAGRPALVHLKIEVEAITPTTTLSAIRAAAEAKKG
jgi:acetolactate synthase-1/2/3 large subunit